MVMEFRHHRSYGLALYQCLTSEAPRYYQCHSREMGQGTCCGSWLHMIMKHSCVSVQFTS